MSLFEAFILGMGAGAFIAFFLAFHEERKYQRIDYVKFHPITEDEARELREKWEREYNNGKH